MKKLRLAAILCAAVVVYPSLGRAQVQGVSDDKIIIGTYNTLSGPAGVFGQAYLHAQQLVFDKVNAEDGINGRKIVLVVEDDRGDPAGGVAAVTKILDADKPFLIFGTTFTPVALASFQKVIDRGIIYWTTSANPRLTKPFQRLVFQSNETLDDSAKPIAKLVASMHPKKIAFIRQNDELGTIDYNAAVDELAKKGLKIDVVETIEPTAISATPQVLRIKSEGANVVIFAGTPKSLDPIVREMYKNGLKAPLVTFGGGNAGSIVSLLTGEAPIEAYLESALACSLEDSCTAEFVKEWTAKYGNPPSVVWAAQGYATTQAFVQGLKLAGRNLTTETLVRALESMPPYTSSILPEPFKFSADNHRGVQGGFFDGFKDGKKYFFSDELK